MIGHRQLLTGFVILLCLLLTACSGTKDQTEKLDIIQETEHAIFYSPDSKEEVSDMIASLAQSFEDQYGRITGLFQYEPADKTVIHVYADKAEFQDMIGRETEGTYVADEKIIKVYTPKNIDDSSIQSEYTFQLVHEFIHAVTQQKNPLVGHIKWLDEGIAYYASNQLEAELQSRSVFNDYPTLEQLADPAYFDEAGGTAYFYCGMIIRYIVQEYGIEALNEIIDDPEQLELILGGSIESIHEEWSKELQQSSL